MDEQLKCPKCGNPEIVLSDTDKDAGKLYECLSCHFCQTKNHFKKISVKNIKITITISALSRELTHKLTITPSVAVNPPAIQYFKGVQWEPFKRNDRITIDCLDNRFEQMKNHVVIMLSSIEYPNPEICTKEQAENVANNLLFKILKQMDSRFATNERNVTSKMSMILKKNNK